MRFDFDLALSEFKKAWAETEKEVQQDIRNKLLETISLNDTLVISLFKQDYDSTPFYRILEHYTSCNDDKGVLKLVDITLSANDDIYSYSDHNLGLAA
jgi:hypothetical protein